MEPQQQNNRHIKLVIGLLVFAAVLLGKIFYIQVVDHSYRQEAVANAMVYESINPTRGIIYDRNHEILVGNKVAYDILVTPREVQAFDTLALARALEVEPAWIAQKLEEYERDRRKIGFQSVVMMRHIPAETYIRFEEIKFKFPGFKGQVSSVRDYPINAGGNLLGYVSEVNQAYIDKDPENYRPGDFAGRTGLEYAREKDLRGEKGYHVFLRNARNQIEGAYNNGAEDKEAIPGKDIVTTIDAQLQQFGQELMAGKVGSVVAIEPGSGEILALISSPSIDVSVLSDFGNNYKALTEDPYKPLMDRAVQSSYPPGSVFKLVNGLIGLQEGVLKPSDLHPCNKGYYYTKTRRLGCHAHRSPINLEEAVMMSCNAYFCYVLKDILENDKYGSIQESFDKWNEYVHSFGFGEKLGSDFPSELSGNIPTSAYYDRIYGKRGWRFQTIVSLSIGQGEIGVTPLHIANLCATVANRGFYYIPHLVKDSEGIEIDPKYHERHYTMVDPKHFEAVIPGMWRAVNGGPSSGGTAWRAAVPGLNLCGKTGTAQNPRGDDNSVFICFAPKDDPKIAIAVYVENGGFGASVAAPIASLMVEKYLTGKVSRPEMEKEIRQKDLMHKVKKDN